AWVIVPAKRGESPVAALCEYRRETSRWRTLRELPRPIVPILSQNSSGSSQGYVPGAALENSLIAACPEKVCFALSPIRRDDKVMALCFDRRLNLWDELPAIPALITDRSAISITWLDVSRDEVWLGTTAGLLRYRLREKQWQRFMPERMVYA